MISKFYLLIFTVRRTSNTGRIQRLGLKNDQEIGFMAIQKLRPISESHLIEEVLMSPCCG